MSCRTWQLWSPSLKYSYITLIIWSGVPKWPLDTTRQANVILLLAAKHEALLYQGSRTTKTMKMQDFLAMTSGIAVSLRWRQQAPWTSVTIYHPKQRHIPEALNHYQHCYEKLISCPVIQTYQLSRIVCTCLPLKMTWSNLKLHRWSICMNESKSSF